MVQRGRRGSGGQPECQHSETVKEGKETLKSLDMDGGSLGLRMPWASHLCLNWLSGALKSSTLNQQPAKSPELDSKQWLCHLQAV